MRRVYATGEAAVREALNQQLTKFEYPDELGGGGGISIGGGGGAPTVVVAASDASEQSKSKADFICPGVNDQAIIRQAVDTLATTFGGRILLTEGSFRIVLDQTNVIETSYPTHIQGMGPDATVLLVDTAPTTANRRLFELSDDNVVSDLEIRQTLYNQTWLPIRFTGNRGWVSRCEFWNLAAGSNGVVSCDNTGLFQFWITDNLFDGCPDAAIFDQAYQIVFTGNVMDNSDGFEATFSTTDGLGVVVANNIWRAPDDDNLAAVIRVEGFVAPVVANNTAISPSGSPLSFIEVDSCVSARIVGNTVFQMCCGSYINVVDSPGTLVLGNELDAFGDNTSDVAIHVSGTSDRTVVANNTLRSDQDTAGNWMQYGIHLDGVDECIVEGNSIHQVADDCIRIEGNRNLVTGNSLKASALTPTTDIGVNIVSGECNMVVGNDIGDPDDYTTDALSDSGANTQLYWPNDATYGDNFTDCGTGS